jgi:hypothetical protein
MAAIMRWRGVIGAALLYVLVDIGTTINAWLQALGEEKFSSISWGSYAMIALYCKVVTGACTTLLSLHNNAWAEAMKASTTETK